ncbi:hypothetical protein NDU88_002851 [Pleurodeles waltl]|uniref:Uncharacterized protein n=1 Tax=Pleurodeles waltl TaxID=8319 RepID=A0AAV7MRR5_PLEWA|nr:hypothetical protein NDU88_002851 [Pleurodeles waltl]
MRFTTPLGIAGHPHKDSWQAPSQTVSRVLRRVIQNAITLVTGLGELVKILPSTLKINMAPKIARNFGDKAEGAKTTHVGKDKGDTVGAAWRPNVSTAKSGGRNITGPGKDVKNGNGITLPLDVRGKDKIQPTITSFQQ